MNQQKKTTMRLYALRHTLLILTSLTLSIAMLVSLTACDSTQHQSKNDKPAELKAVELSRDEKNEIGTMLEYTANRTYDSSDPAQEGIALFLTISPREGLWGMSQYPMLEGKAEEFVYDLDSKHYKKDPLKAFKGGKKESFMGYIKFEGKAVDWMMNHILNFKPTHPSEPTPFYNGQFDSDDPEGLRYYYYKGNYYMEFFLGLGDNLAYGLSFEKVVSDGQTYYIEYRHQYAASMAEDGEDYGSPIETSYATFRKAIIDGKEYWSIVKLSDTSYFDFSPYYPDKTDESWKKLYLSTIKKSRSGGNDFHYSLAYIDDNTVPELIIERESYAGGGEIYTVYNDKLSSLDIGTYGLKYIEKKNRFINSHGHMDDYDDTVYQIEKGKFVRVAGGHFGLDDDTDLSHIKGDIEDYYSYYWGDKKVSKAQYQKNLKKAFDATSAITPYHRMWNADIMFRRIKNGFYDVYPIHEIPEENN